MSKFVRSLSVEVQSCFDAKLRRRRGESAESATDRKPSAFASVRMIDKDSETQPSGQILSPFQIGSLKSQQATTSVDVSRLQERSRCCPDRQ